MHEFFCCQMAYVFLRAQEENDLQCSASKLITAGRWLTGKFHTGNNALHTLTISRHTHYIEPLADRKYGLSISDDVNLDCRSRTNQNMHPSEDMNFAILFIAASLFRHEMEHSHTYLLKLSLMITIYRKSYVSVILKYQIYLFTDSFGFYHCRLSLMPTELVCLYGRLRNECVTGQIHPPWSFQCAFRRFSFPWSWLLPSLNAGFPAISFHESFAFLLFRFTRSSYFSSLYRNADRIILRRFGRWLFFLFKTNILQLGRLTLASLCTMFWYNTTIYWRSLEMPRVLIFATKMSFLSMSLDAN